MPRIVFNRFILEQMWQLLKSPQLSLRGAARRSNLVAHGMSLYALQKLIRDVNRSPESREAWFKDRQAFAAGYDLSQDERTALLDLDIGKLYAMGTHALL